MAAKVGESLTAASEANPFKSFKPFKGYASFKTKRANACPMVQKFKVGFGERGTSTFREFSKRRNDLLTLAGRAH
jgi:hypothetical protein